MDMSRSLLSVLFAALTFSTAAFALTEADKNAIAERIKPVGDVYLAGSEPVQAAPVIIEDDCFVGSRCIVVEGVRVGKEAVLGAGLTLTMSTKVIDVETGEEWPRGYIPERSVVIPGNIKKTFTGGDFYVPAALIIGKRKR